MPKLDTAAVRFPTQFSGVIIDNVVICYAAQVLVNEIMTMQHLRALEVERLKSNCCPRNPIGLRYLHHSRESSQ